MFLESRKFISVLSSLTLILLLGITSCTTSPSPTNQTTSPEPSPSNATPAIDQDLSWMEKVTNAWVVAHRHDWDADAEDDGIRVWVELLDNEEEMIEYTNVTMPAKIQIYSTESRTFPWKPSRLIYSADASLYDWRDDAFVSGAIGVKDIAWEEISPPLSSEQQEYGLIYVTVTLPNSEQYSARYDEARITKP